MRMNYTHQNSWSETLENTKQIEHINLKKEETIEEIIISKTICSIQLQQKHLKTLIIYCV